MSDYLYTRPYTHEPEPRTPRQPRDVCALCGRAGHELSNCPRVVNDDESRDYQHQQWLVGDDMPVPEPEYRPAISDPTWLEPLAEPCLSCVTADCDPFHCPGGVARGGGTPRPIVAGPNSASDTERHRDDDSDGDPCATSCVDLESSIADN
jgi:hypothetical protein